MRNFHLIALLAAGLVACASPEGVGTRLDRPGAAAVGGVASAETAATEVGLALLGAGGNAADAAVATALALAVVHPQAGNLGGGGFAVVKWGPEAAALDFRETAPAGAHRDMYLADDGSPIPGASTVGPLAAGVPGSPSGLFELHRRYGRTPWPQVVRPAIILARDGFVVSPRLHSAIVHRRAELGRFEESASVWLPGGGPPAIGTVMRLPELASTLERYAAEGPDGVMRGGVATAIVAASGRHGGLISADDLAGYRPVWRDPLRFEAFGWQIASMPLPSSGGIIVGESLLMLQQLGWRDMPRSEPARLHLLAESWRRAYADRYELGDPESSHADAADLFEPAWIARRAASIDPGRATPSDDVRPWPGGSGELPGATTHLSVVDADGNLVALTTTLNGWFGCFLLVKGAGFFLNNEMDDFATAPGQPNMFGLVQGEANAVRAGARMLSSMTPTVAWRGGEAVALGSPGGGRIPTATAQVLLNLIVDGDTLEDAIRRPRLHHQWQPDELRIEPLTLTPAARQVLERLGHRLREVKYLGEVHGVRIRQDGVREAVADQRGPGAAGVVTGESDQN